MIPSSLLKHTIQFILCEARFAFTSVCSYTTLYAHRGQKEGTGDLELKLWVLGTEPRPSARVTSSLLSHLSSPASLSIVHKYVPGHPLKSVGDMYSDN